MAPGCYQSSPRNRQSLTGAHRTDDLWLAYIAYTQPAGVFVSGHGVGCVLETRRGLGSGNEPENEADSRSGVQRA